MGWPPIFTLFTISANCEALVALEWYAWWLSHYKKDMVQIESHFFYPSRHQALAHSKDATKNMAYVMLDFQCSLQIFQQFLKLLLQQALKLMKMNHKLDIAF